MARFSPKIEIINHFDNMINRVDIDIENSLEYYNNEKTLGELLKSEEYYNMNFRNKYDRFHIKFFNTFNSSKHQCQIQDSWTETTKVIDYLKQVRMKTIEELRNAQEDTLDYYKLNCSRFKSLLSNERNIDELRSELFAQKFYFQIIVSGKQSGSKLWALNVFTFVTDFYMSPSDIDSLEKLINDEKEPFSRDYNFDEKTVLIGLVYKYFIVNFSNFPNHVIRVCKEDVLNIKTITYSYEYSRVNLTSSSTIDLSKLVYLYLDCKNQRESVKFNIEGLSSLKLLSLTANSTEINISIKNLTSLMGLNLEMNNSIDQNVLTQLLDKVQNIEQLGLYGNISYLNLDYLVNLKKLTLVGTISESFNFDFFKNLAYQLEGLKINFKNIDEKNFFKLFDGYNFSNLHNLNLSSLIITRFKKEFINPFPRLKKLFILDCNLEEIEQDAFYNFKHLNILDLSHNRLKFIEKNTFSNLKNLQILDLSQNKLKNLDAEFIGVRNSVKIFQNKLAYDTYRHYWARNNF